MRILLSVVGCLVFALPSVAQSTELSRFQVFAGAAENEHLSGLGIARDYGRILRQPAECPDFSSKGVLKSKRTSCFLILLSRNLAVSSKVHFLQEVHFGSTKGLQVFHFHQEDIERALGLEV